MMTKIMTTKIATMKMTTKTDTGSNMKKKTNDNHTVGNKDD